MIGHLIQIPNEKPECEIVIYGHQGIGKDFLGFFIGCLIGHNSMGIYSNMDNFLKNFNSEQSQVLVCVLNELNGSNDSNAKNNQLKEKITGKKKRIEKKGVDAFFTKCYNRMFGFTNNENFGYIEKTDRRYCLIKADNSVAQQKEYFEPLWKDAYDIDMIKLAFGYYANRNISNFTPRNPPITQYKQELKEKCLSTPIRFLKYIFIEMEHVKQERLLDYGDKKEEKKEIEHEIDEIPHINIHTDEFYRAYRNFCSQNTSKILQKITFVSQLKEWGFVASKFRMTEIKKTKLTRDLYGKYGLQYGNNKVGFSIGKDELLTNFRLNFKDPTYCLE